MRYKTIVSAVLLLFVAASVVYLVLSESRTGGNVEGRDTDNVYGRRERGGVGFAEHARA